jgi:NhaP-type Na+/H+ or K+/H+ antiporter
MVRDLMEFSLVVMFVGILVFLAHLFSALFERTRVPDVLFLMLVGVVIGPIFRVVSPDDFGKVGHVFTTIALAVILFEGGLELDLNSMRTSLRSTAVITFLSYLIALIFTTTATFSLTGFSLISSLYVGAVLAGPAPALVIPLVRQLRLSPRPKTVLVLESAFGEALCVLFSLAVVESLKLGELRVGRQLGTLISSFLLAIVLGVAGGFLWSIALNKIRELQHAMFLTPAVVLLLFGLTSFLGFSGPVTALAFGITIGNAEMLQFRMLERITPLIPIRHNETERAFFGEIVFLLKTFFFVYIGISLSVTDWWMFAMAGIITLTLVLARLVSVRLGTDRHTTTVRDARIMATMIPKGTAAAVLGSLLLQMGLVEGQQVQSLIYNVVALSIVLTALLVFLMEKTPLAHMIDFAFRRYPETLFSVADETDNQSTSTTG